jgi:hypothetical protein
MRDIHPGALFVAFLFFLYLLFFYSQQLDVVLTMVEPGFLGDLVRHTQQLVQNRADEPIIGKSAAVR